MHGPTKLFLFLCFCAVSTACAASTSAAGQAIAPAEDSYYRDLKGTGVRGWFWYEELPKKEEPALEAPAAAQPAQDILKEERRPELKDYTKRQLWDMHPDEFKRLYDVFEKRAIQTLDPADVYATKVMKNVASRKSYAFASVDGYVGLMHPELSTEDAVPASAPGRNSSNRAKTAAIEERLQRERDNFALVYFYSNSCLYCMDQSDIMRMFVKRNGWKVKGINREKDPATFARFGVQTTPTIIIIGRDMKQSMPISTGAIALDEMEVRAYRAVRVVTGEIKPEQFFMMDFEEGGALDPLAPLESGKETW
jgi:conjugal transfer pilus assembly protein TraF